MCVIAIKGKEAAFPSEERLRGMFNANNDGAGFMYRRRDGKIQIKKGFMKFKHLMRAISAEDIDSDAIVVYHFRISTSGGISRGNTHPFPISSAKADLKSLSISSEVGIAHNGVLPYKADEKEELSDTMTFIRDVLSGPVVKGNIFDPDILFLVGQGIGSSKMVFLGKDGFVTLGEWKTDDDAKDGLLYSNLYFKVRKTFSSFSSSGTYVWDNRLKKLVPDPKDTSFYSNSSNGRRPGTYPASSCFYCGGTNIVAHSRTSRNNMCDQCFDLWPNMGIPDKAPAVDGSGVIFVENGVKACPSCGYDGIGDHHLACPKCTVFFDRRELMASY